MSTTHQMKECIRVKICEVIAEVSDGICMFLIIDLYEQSVSEMIFRIFQKREGQKSLINKKAS